ncbi:hypothetical protein A8C56_02990 [Niabella ginsenosidivorans]|uniref:Uncharacterized protein n=1 Tax=Niabella ginsenosidivorans TaxID=1176587 RepID=A0A1A9HXH3_9BACT|nr:BT4734/BF3469 family protein [Niabella ginsenosidivorans]ANH80087.1 hypothetical protein A8C56_02990 [Niabella ginsenosidivorans]
MKWQQQQVSLYSSHGDRTGEVVPIGEVLRSRFAENISDIVALRSLDNDAPDYQQRKRDIKSRLQCFAPSALLADRKDVLSYSGIIQIDFDAVDIQDYDIDELKAAVFTLPFVCFVSLSCSGCGFYALALIAEPERQKEYALHIFDVLQTYSISCDRSKGRNYNDLRYVSYDSNMDWKDEVEPLRVTHFKTNTATLPANHAVASPRRFNGNHSGLINQQVQKILSAQIGQRWLTIQQAAYTLGGVNTGLDAIQQAIQQNPAFHGEENKYLKCAADCYAAGVQKPL